MIATDHAPTHDTGEAKFLTGSAQRNYRTGNLPSFLRSANLVDTGKPTCSKVNGTDVPGARGLYHLMPDIWQEGGPCRSHSFDEKELWKVSIFSKSSNTPFRMEMKEGFIIPSAQERLFIVSDSDGIVIENRMFKCKK